MCYFFPYCFFQCFSKNRTRNARLPYCPACLVFRFFTNRTEDVQRMIHRIKIVKFACGLNYFMYTGITEFNNLTGSDIDQMIVLAAMVGPFKLGNVFAELVFDNQAAVE